MDDFVSLVQTRFSFLVESEGFTCKPRGESHVLYSGPASSIYVGLGRGGEVGITVSRTDSQDYPFEFYLKVFYPDEAARLQESYGTSKLEVDVSLLRLARLLQQFGQPVIAGDADVFRRMSAELAASL